MSGKFEIKKIASGRYDLHLKTDRDETILTTQIHSENQHVKDALDTLLDQAMPEKVVSESKPQYQSSSSSNESAPEEDELSESELYRFLTPLLADINEEMRVFLDDLKARLDQLDELDRTPKDEDVHSI